MNFTVNKKFTAFFVFFGLNIVVAIAPVNGQVPSWIDEYPPEEEIWGVGYAKLVNSGNSMYLAELRARSDIARQIFYTARAWANDDESNDLYLFFMMHICVEASFEIMNATIISARWTAPDGASWCRIAIKKSDIGRYTGIIEHIYETYYREFLGN